MDHLPRIETIRTTEQVGAHATARAHDSLGQEASRGELIAYRYAFLMAEYDCLRRQYHAAFREAEDHRNRLDVLETDRLMNANF